MTAKPSVKIDIDALEALLADWNRTDAPGIVAGVAHPSISAWKRGYGLASLELPVVNTPRTRMRIGSTSKMFTCLAVMLLAQEGKLSIDEPVRKHIPELPDWADAITPRHFMTHTSGMRCHIDLLFYTGNWARPAPETALATLVRQTDVNFAPGDRWSYNNGGYALLTLIVERLSGLAFEDFLTQRILAPIGMADSALKRSDSQLFANSASLHVRHEDGSFHRGFFGCSIAGEGAMVSTVEDMLLWLKHMHRPVVGTAATWAAMTTALPLNDGREHGYALGLMTGDYRGVRVWHHAGGVTGGVCMCVTAPDLDLDIILIANRGDAPVQPLAFQIIDACVQGLTPLPEEVVAPPLTGLFYSRDTGGLLALEDKDGRQAASLFGAELPIRRAGPASLASSHPVLDLTIAADLDAAGAVSALEVALRGSTDRFEPLEAAPDPAEAARIEGVFACDEVEAAATIRASGDGLTLRFDGPYGRDLYALQQVRRGLWTSRCVSEPESGLAGVLEFAADAGGFSLTTPRTRRLAFVRASADTAFAGRTLGAGSA